MTKLPLGSIRFETSLISPTLHGSLAATSISTMKAESRRPKEREGAISALNVAIEALNLAKEISSITPAKAVFGSVSFILVMIRVSFLLGLC